MKIVLATGVYPPEIGGPATYVRALAEELVAAGHHVHVIAFGEPASSPWPTTGIPRNGGPLVRWWKYARAFREIAADAHVVEAFSLFSVGVPLLLSRLRGPKRVIRLGGDFGWERATDRGDRRTLKEWYASHGILPLLSRIVAGILLGLFDHVIFSSAFQRDIFHAAYHRLPSVSVIENALQESTPLLHTKHDPLRLLFLGRLVRFKSIPLLVAALAELPHMTLTVVGDGTANDDITTAVTRAGVETRVVRMSASSASATRCLFDEHDLLVLPSLTEISPNTALEARASGLPVLLTTETGLSPELCEGMTILPLRTVHDIVRAILDIDRRYDEIATAAGRPVAARPWSNVAAEHLSLFSKLCQRS